MEVRGYGAPALWDAWSPEGGAGLTDQGLTPEEEERTAQKREETSSNTVVEQMLEAWKKDDDNGMYTPEQKRVRDQIKKWAISKKLGYSSTRHLMRLARLYQTVEVRKFIGSVNANIYQVKSSRGYDKKEVGRAVVQMQQIIQRARVKVRKMEEENLTKSAAEKAAKRRAYAKARAMEQELKKRRAARKAREYGEARVGLAPPLDLAGMGKSPWEKWEETCGPRSAETPAEGADLAPGAVAAPAAAVPSGRENPTVEQAAAMAEAAVSSRAAPPAAGGSIDVCV